MAKLTVFTPTYNRAELLARCYESLRRQTRKDFVWLVIDDGSTDETRQRVADWMAETEEFSVRYHYKENGGLHTGYNAAIALADTELCVCIDSDDFLPEDAVEKILACWESRGSDRVAGIVGLDCDLEGHVIGDPLPDRETVNLIDLLTGKYPIRHGDRTVVVRAELYRKFAPMEVFPGEKYFNPHYLHLQISREYDFLALNENLRFVEYQPTGMSRNILSQYRNSPRSFAETRKLYLSFPDTPLAFRFRHCVHYVSSSILAGNRNFLAESPARLLTLPAVPLGICLTLYICLKTRR